MRHREVASSIHSMVATRSAPWLRLPRVGDRTVVSPHEQGWPRLAEVERGAVAGVAVVGQVVDDVDESGGRPGRPAVRSGCPKALRSTPAARVVWRRDRSAFGVRRRVRTSRVNRGGPGWPGRRVARPARRGGPVSGRASRRPIAARWRARCPAGGRRDDRRVSRRPRWRRGSIGAVECSLCRSGPSWRPAAAISDPSGPVVRRIQSTEPALDPVPIRSGENRPVSRPSRPTSGRREDRARRRSRTVRRSR